MDTPDERDRYERDQERERQRAEWEEERRLAEVELSTHPASVAVGEVSQLLRRIEGIVFPLMEAHHVRPGHDQVIQPFCPCVFCRHRNAVWPVVAAAAHSAYLLGVILDERRPWTRDEIDALWERHERREREWEEGEEQRERQQAEQEAEARRALDLLGEELPPPSRIKGKSGRKKKGGG